MTPDDISALPYRPCVGVMLANSLGQVWVGERIDTPGAWQMPQGGIDKGETPQIAALRELTEETSVPAGQVKVIGHSPDWLAYDLPHDLVPRLWKGRFRGQKQMWFLMQLTGADSLIDLNTEHPEFSRWQWMAPDALLSHIVPFKRAVYEDVLRAFEPLLKSLPSDP